MSKIKLKSHKSLLKRVEKTGSGKLRARKMSIAHRARFKSKRAKGEVDQKLVLSAGHHRKLKKIINI